MSLRRHACPTTHEMPRAVEMKNAMLMIRAALFQLAMLLVPPVSWAGGDTPATIDWAKVLDARAVEIEEVSTPDGVPGVRAWFAVAATREQVWRTLLDYENFPKIFRGIERMQVLEKDDRHAFVELWVDSELGKAHYLLERRYERPGYRLSWRRLSGDLERVEGSWDIRDSPRAGAVLLVYESYVVVGWYMPATLFRWMAKRRVADMATGLRHWIEADTTDRALPRH